MKKSKICDGNRGFTLVELIVVLVILAILAAILVPALLGYIDRARSRQDILNAKNCMTATQAELTYMYANRKDSFTDATGTNTATSGDYGDLFLCLLSESVNMMYTKTRIFTRLTHAILLHTGERKTVILYSLTDQPG